MCHWTIACIASDTNAIEVTYYTISSNIQQIYNKVLSRVSFQRSFYELFNPGYNILFDRTQGSSSVAKVFLQKLTEFRIYSEFIKFFPLSIKTLEVWREKEERLNKLLTIFQVGSRISLIHLLRDEHLMEFEL